MVTLNNSMCGATANFPETVLADLGGQTLVFDYTPDSAGWSGPGPFCEGYIQRDSMYAGLYDLFAEMPDYWTFHDGMDWWSDCTLINGVDGAAGFTIGGISFVPESVPVVRTGSAARPSSRAIQGTRSNALLFGPDPDILRMTSAVRLVVEKPLSCTSTAPRLAAFRASGTGFGNQLLDATRPNLVCVWKLNEAIGTRIDAISGEDLSPHNSPAGASGKDGSACVFANASGHGLYRDHTSLGPLGAHGADTEIAVSTWIHAATLGYRSIGGFIDDMGGMGPWSVSLGYQNRIYVNIATHDWDNAYAQTGGITAGEWHNLVFTFSSGGHLRVYLDGTLAATGDTYGGGGGLAQPYSPFTIGCGYVYDWEQDTYSYGNSWDGLIDETCVWNALPADPDAFASALWNGGQGAFYRIDSTRRAASRIVLAGRDRVSILRRESFESAADLALAGTGVRFGAARQLAWTRDASRQAARAPVRHERTDMFEILFGLNPTRTAFAHRAVVRRQALASAATPAEAAARRSTMGVHGTRIVALADTVSARFASPFSAVAYRNYLESVCRGACRCPTAGLSPVRPESVLGMDLFHAAVAVRHAARELSGTAFGNPILDALGAHLVSCWKLEEDTGTRIDAISGENLSQHSTPTGVPGLDGQASRFSNAESDGLYRERENLGPLGTHGEGVQLTFSTWLYPETLGYRSIGGFIDDVGGMGPWSVSLGYQNRIYVNITTHDYDYAYCQSGSISAGTWHHVLFTYDAGGHLRLYVDGALAATGNTYSGNGGLAQPWSPFTLGCGWIYDYEHDTQGYGNSWDGLIDETCVWRAVPDDPDLFAAAMWNAGKGLFLHIDPRHRTLMAARGELRAATVGEAAARALADQELERAASLARALATRYTVEANTGTALSVRGRTSGALAARAQAEYIVALTRLLSAVRPRVRRDLSVLECARTALGLDARAATSAAGAAFMKAVVERLHADHGVRPGAGMKVTFAASADLFDIRAATRVTTGEHPGARKLLVWTIPHLTSARDGMGTRTPVVWLARARQDALHRVRITLRAPQAGITQARHDAFTLSGWRLLARNTATRDVLDLGFVPARNDGSGGSLVDVALPDGDWQIEPRPADWFWSDCRGRAVSSVGIRDGRIINAGLPAILNLHGEVTNQRRIVRWEIAAELLPQTFQFGVWTATASPVDTSGAPVATVPFSQGRGSYLYTFTQAAPLHLAVAAFDAEGTGPVAELFLDWAVAPPASPVNQLAH
jgi:hypothetical protein